MEYKDMPVDKLLWNTRMYPGCVSASESAAELGRRLADAQATVEALQAKVELQEAAVRSAGYALDESREAHNRQVAKIRNLQEQLSQFQALVRSLLEFKCEDRPEQFSKENPMYEKGDEACPFFTEAYLYVLLGKADARSLLAITRQLRALLPTTLDATTPATTKT